MEKSTKKKFSANEKEIAELLKTNEVWKTSMSNISEEISFLHILLNADIFGKDALDLDDTLEDFLEDLETMKRRNLELIKEVHNHRFDIEGMMECEDIGCEVFYHEQHLNLGKKITEFETGFNRFKLAVFSSTGKLLKKGHEVE